MIQVINKQLKINEVNLVLDDKVRINQIKKGIPSYYVMAQDSDFNGTANGEFKYIGSHEYVIIPHVIKGVNVTSYKGMFAKNTVVRGVRSNNRNVTNMRYMFFDNHATSLDLSSLDTSNVTDMSWMFYNNQASSLDLSSFNTSNVTSMFGMFYENHATSLDLSNFDTSNVTSMGSMFYYSQATTLDLSSFDTSNVIYMSGMFYSSKATSLDLSSFNTSNVRDTYRMFNSVNAKSVNVRTQDDARRFKNSYGVPIDLKFVVK